MSIVKCSNAMKKICLAALILIFFSYLGIHRLIAEAGSESHNLDSRTISADAELIA